MRGEKISKRVVESTTEKGGGVLFAETSASWPEGGGGGGGTYEKKRTGRFRRMKKKALTLHLKGKDYYRSLRKGDRGGAVKRASEFPLKRRGEKTYAGAMTLRETESTASQKKKSAMTCI